MFSLVQIPPTPPSRRYITFEQPLVVVVVSHTQKGPQGVKILFL